MAFISYFFTITSAVTMHAVIDDRSSMNSDVFKEDTSCSWFDPRAEDCGENTMTRRRTAIRRPCSETNRNLRTVKRKPSPNLTSRTATTTTTIEDVRSTHHLNVLVESPSSAELRSAPQEAEAPRRNDDDDDIEVERDDLEPNGQQKKRRFRLKSLRRRLGAVLDWFRAPARIMRKKKRSD